MICSGYDPVSRAVLEVTCNGVIQSVDHSLTAMPDAHYLSTGWIDLQVNGFGGVDYNSPATSMEAIERSLRAQFACGVTRLLPTIITGSPENIIGCLRNLDNARESLPHGKAMEGFHVEGPHISPEDGPRGAHPQRWVRPPDIDEFRRWQEAARGHVRLVTLSPEWPQAPRYIEALVSEGVVVSVGHTKATGAQIADAVRAGATLSTHLGNGAHAVMQRHPNYIWEQLANDGLAASFIVDGIHLPESFLKVALRAKGVERSILVTDAVMPAGCEPGEYRLGEVEVELKPEGCVVLRGGTRLAGSALRMDRAIENVMKLGGVSLPEALAMASRNPARVGRIAMRQRGLAAGEHADLVEYRYDDAAKSVEVLRTFVGGEPAYPAN